MSNVKRAWRKNKHHMHGLKEKGPDFDPDVGRTIAQKTGGVPPGVESVAACDEEALHRLHLRLAIRLA